MPSANTKTTRIKGPQRRRWGGLSTGGGKCIFVMRNRTSTASRRKLARYYQWPRGGSLLGLIRNGQRHRIVVRRRRRSRLHGYPAVNRQALRAAAAGAGQRVGANG